MEFDFNLFTKRIVDRRKELGLTLQQLQDLTGISRSALQRYEHAGFDNISTSKLQKIADALDVTPSYLFGAESKGLPHARLEHFSGLLKQINLNLKYDQKSDSYLVHDGVKTKSLTENQVISLIDETLNFISFRLYNMTE